VNAPTGWGAKYSKVLDTVQDFKEMSQQDADWLLT
jgi:hypothetical protein